MDIHVIQKIRRLCQTDPQFRCALQDDPMTALTRWELGGSETTEAMADSLRVLLSCSSEEILTSILEEDLPVWHGVPPELVVSG